MWQKTSAEWHKAHHYRKEHYAQQHLLTNMQQMQWNEEDMWILPFYVLVWEWWISVRCLQSAVTMMCWLFRLRTSSLVSAAALGHGPLPLQRITADVYRTATGMDWLQQTHKHTWLWYWWCTEDVQPEEL